MDAASAESERFRRELYARTPFSPSAMDRLRTSKVGIVGDGSGGSSIALTLARAGVGEIRNSDPAVLELANVSRHELDRTAVGSNKAEAIAARIHQINNYIKAEPFPCDLFAPEFEAERNRFFESLDLIIGATDKTAVQLQINREAITRKIPAVFGGCYESARGGEVLFWLPGFGMPCLECLRGGLAQPEPSGNIDYSSASGPEDYEGEPGLYGAIQLINAVEIQIALAVLLRDDPTSELGKLIDPKVNFLLIGGALAAGFYRFRKAFDIFWQPLKGPRRNCGACQTPATDAADVEQAIARLEQLRDVPTDLDRFVQ